MSNRNENNEQEIWNASVRHSELMQELSSCIEVAILIGIVVVMAVFFTIIIAITN